MTLHDAIAFLDQRATEPTRGLPEAIFLFASRITPLINVDLLIRDAAGRTLLAWRDDAFSGKGWHIPGGIIRFKELAETRIQQVALQELGTEVTFSAQPIALHQLIHPTRNTRGHFLSLLYLCAVPETFDPSNNGRREEEAGYLQWHEDCPHNLIGVHEVYRPYINRTRIFTEITSAS